MWEFDSVELWAEEEQIGLGFVTSGKPALFKYRFHNREGKEWSADYALPDDGIWGVQLRTCRPIPSAANWPASRASRSPGEADTP